MPMDRRRALAVLLTVGGLLCGPAVLAQDAPQAPPAATCDHAVTPCLTTEGYVLILRAWTQGHEPRNLAGGRGQVELRYRNLRVGGRLDGTAAAGQYRQGDLSTIRTVEGHLSVAYEALRLPGSVALGPAIAAGGAVSLESQDGIRASLPRVMTAVLGARISWPGGWAQGGAGMVQEFERGLGFKATWQLRTSERTVHIGTVSWGRRRVADVLGPGGEVAMPAHSTATWFAWIGEGVRFK
jgi:hypothetical protein